MLYGPAGEARSYDLVVHSDLHCISIFRTDDVSEAEARFSCYQTIIPPFLDANGDLCSAFQLQRLCDCIRQHPDWSLAHIAVACDQADLVGHFRFRDVISLPDMRGVTPLMLAVERANKTTLCCVRSAGADLAVSDKEGNNVFHYAAVTTGAIIDHLADPGPQGDKADVPLLLNQCNQAGHTPLHLACQADKPDCVKALLSSGADVNVVGSVDKEYPIHKAVQGTGRCAREILAMYPNQLDNKDMKHGGTPLHWVTDKPLLEALLDLGCNINSKNFCGSTALHSMVRNKRLPCLVSLLSHGAAVDELDSDGNTALHLAVQTGDVSYIPTIEALLVFGADFSIKNKVGDNVWYQTLRAFEKSYLNYDKERDQILHCLQAIGATGPSDLTPGSKDFEWKPQKSKTKVEDDVHRRCRHLLDEFLEKGALNCKEVDRKGVRVLSLDGGGIRGLVLVKMLCAISDHLKLPITHCFDWISGTSTGGILSLALASGLTPIECQGLYFRLKDKVFVGKRPYAVEPLEDFLKKQFTEEARMSDLPPKPRIAVTGVLADRYPADLHLFRNYQDSMEILGIQDDLLPGMSPRKRSDEQPIWRAGRSSGAAPTYFRASGRFIDGGLIGNNPTLDIMTEIQERNAALKAVGREDEVEQLGAVVSLGTGEAPVVKIDSIDLFRPDSMLGVGQMMSGISAMGNLGKILVEQASSSSTRVVDRARAMCGWIGVPYIRLSPQLDVDIVLDEVGDEVLVHMLWITQAYMHQQRNNLVQLAGILTKGQTIYCNK